MENFKHCGACPSQKYWGDCLDPETLCEYGIPCCNGCSFCDSDGNCTHLDELEEEPSQISHYNTNEHADMCHCDECEAKRRGFQSVKEMYEAFESEDENRICEGCGCPKGACICKCSECGKSHVPGECIPPPQTDEIPF